MASGAIAPKQPLVAATATSINASSSPPVAPALSSFRSLQEHPAWAPTHRVLAACYAHKGQLDKASETIRQLRAITPVIVPSAAHWRKPEHRELFLSGLRLAAGEEKST